MMNQLLELSEIIERDRQRIVQEVRESLIANPDVSIGALKPMSLIDDDSTKEQRVEILGRLLMSDIREVTVYADALHQ